MGYPQKALAVTSIYLLNVRAGRLGSQLTIGPYCLCRRFKSKTRPLSVNVYKIMSSDLILKTIVAFYLNHVLLPNIYKHVTKNKQESGS